MKKLLIGLLAVGSVSSFAAEIIENFNVVKQGVVRIHNTYQVKEGAIQTLDSEVEKACGKLHVITDSYRYVKPNKEGTAYASVNYKCAKLN